MVEWSDDNLNPIKGAIGELLERNAAGLLYGVEFKDPNLQFRGVDAQIAGYLPINTDAKLNDALGDYFKVALLNKGYSRHPAAPNSSVDWLAIVSYDWDLFLQDNGVVYSSSDSEEIKSDKQTKELKLAKETRDRLKKEELSKKFVLTQQLLDKYTQSIIYVRAHAIRTINEALKSLPDGDELSRRGRTYARRERHGRDYTAAYIWWWTVSPFDREVKWSNPKLDNHHPSLLAPWHTARSKFSAIIPDEKGKTLSEMKIESLEFLLSESRKTGSPRRSTLHVGFGFDDNQEGKAQFQQVLEMLINRHIDFK